MKFRSTTLVEVCSHIMATTTVTGKTLAYFAKRISPKLRCYMHTGRKLKLVLTVSLLVGAAFIITYCATNGFNGFQCAAFLFGYLGIVFYSLLLFIILRADDLHHVRVRRRRHSSTYSLFVPMEVDNDTEREIHSISDVIGLCGSNMEKIANSVLFTLSGMAAGCIISRIMEEPFNVEYIFAFGCPVGMWLINAWSVNSDCICEKMMHLLGAGLYVSGSIICFGYQQDWNSVQQLLALGAMSFASLFVSFWVTLQVFGLKQYMSTYYQSVVLICLEIALMVCCNTCNCLYLYNM